MNNKNKIVRRKKIIAIIAVFLAVLMVLGTLAPIFMFFTLSG